MNLRLFAVLGAAIGVLAPDIARADIGSATIDITFRVPLEDGDYTDPDDFTDSNEITRNEFLNFAHCQCSVEDPGSVAVAGPGSFQIELQLLRNGATVPTGEDAELVVGSNCDNDDFAVRDCETIDSINDVLLELDAPSRYYVPSRQFMFANESSCGELEGTRNIYVLLDEENDGLIDQSFFKDYQFDTEPPPLPDDIEINGAENSIQIDWDVPDVGLDDVEYYQVLCAKEDGSAAFSSRRDDPEYDTAVDLCGSSTRVPILTPSGGGTGVDAGTGQDAGVDAGSGDGADAGADAGPGGNANVPDWMSRLDPNYICGTTGQSSVGINIGNLENGTAYRIALLSIDNAKNVTAIDLGTVNPSPAIDFWEDYHNQGGSADGGICLVTSTFGDGGPIPRVLRDFRDQTLAHFALGRAFIDAYYRYIAPLGTLAESSLVARIAAAAVLAPLAALAALYQYTDPGTKLLLLALVFMAWRTLRRWRASEPRGRENWGHRPAIAAAAALTVLALTLTTSQAHAQIGSPDPYWEDFAPVIEENPDPASLGAVYWNIGIKLGPYTPDVDDGVPGGGDGPYERVFGGPSLMTMIEVDRYLYFPAGQFGITASLGFTTKGATAFQSGACPDGQMCVPDGGAVEDGSGDPVRAPGNTIAFRLIPMFAGVVYRYTDLDDRWRVPIVPYARAGLSYYLWWSTAPDGSFAEVPDSDCPDLNGCDGDRALGASIGWQASLGIAIRAERLDPQAARNMRNDIGIAHTGIYAEVLFADVDHFGSDSRLSVGDLTWFGGINFEF